MICTARCTADLQRMRFHGRGGLPRCGQAEPTTFTINERAGAAPNCARFRPWGRVSTLRKLPFKWCFNRFNIVTNVPPQPTTLLTDAPPLIEKTRKHDTHPSIFTCNTHTRRPHRAEVIMHIQCFSYAFLVCLCLCLCVVIVIVQ